jgi:hypothetical protein
MAEEAWNFCFAVPIRGERALHSNKKTSDFTKYKPISFRWLSDMVLSRSRCIATHDPRSKEFSLILNPESPTGTRRKRKFRTQVAVQGVPTAPQGPVLPRHGTKTAEIGVFRPDSPTLVPTPSFRVT